MCYGDFCKEGKYLNNGCGMKTLRYALLFNTAIAMLTARADPEPFKVIVEAKWQDLENNPDKIKQFGGKWILVGSITFKKRSSEMIFLDELQLTWKGEKIDNLIGSLYEKNDSSSSFLPIEKYHICDSTWKRSAQKLFLRFNRNLTLGAVNTFYLVLTVPEEIESILKNGHFSVEKDGLPLHYREYVKERKLSIAINDLPNFSTTT